MFTRSRSRPLFDGSLHSNTDERLCFYQRRTHPDLYKYTLECSKNHSEIQFVLDATIGIDLYKNIYLKALFLVTKDVVVASLQNGRVFSVLVYYAIRGFAT